MNYDEFIQTKAARYAGAGIEINTSESQGPSLFNWTQFDTVSVAA